MRRNASRPRVKKSSIKKDYLSEGIIASVYDIPELFEFEEFICSILDKYIYFSKVGIHSSARLNGLERYASTGKDYTYRVFTNRNVRGRVTLRGVNKGRVRIFNFTYNFMTKSGHIHQQTIK